MENLDLKQMSALVDIIAEEKGLPRETVLSVIEQAIAAAWRKEAGEREMNVRATLNTQTGEADVYIARNVIEDGVGFNPATEIPLAEAIEAVKSGAETLVTPEDGEPRADGEVQIGDVVEEKLKVSTFGRVAAMTAKQVVIQRLREAENDAVLAEYEDKIGTVVTGTVARIEPKLVRIDLGRASGIMPRSEQIDGEYYSVGHRIKVYIKNIEKGDRGTQLILSRGNPEFIEHLFRQEVPELSNGTVEIRGIAREAGRRTKIAVVSTIPGIDPVGTFVGGRGIRVQAVMNEIGDREKIDIINWSDNASEYIREALSPAEITNVEIDGKKAKVFVSEDQQKIAIGTKGQNVRLASKLTGFDIDIELLKKAGRNKRKNIEDSLLSAVEASEQEEIEKFDEPSTADAELENLDEPAKIDDASVEHKDNGEVVETEVIESAEEPETTSEEVVETEAIETAETSEQEHEGAE